MDGILGFIMAFPGTYAPDRWLFCHGQELPIVQYQALFALIGTIYGGNGQTTFALPDLRSRLPIGSMQGPGLSRYTPGETGGSEAVHLSLGQLPRHNHQPMATDRPAHDVVPNDHIWAEEPTGGTALYTRSVPDGKMSPAALAPAGGAQAHSNIQPYLALNYIICVEGTWPERG